MFASLSINAQKDSLAIEKPFYFATGVGHSYGGLGIRVQVRYGATKGIGFHAGAGDAGIPPGLGFSAGIKYFPWKTGWYANIQYGNVGFEEHRDSYFDPQRGFIATNPNALPEYNKVYGPMFLLGGDFAWGKKVQFGFNAAAGLSYWLTTKFGGAGKFNIAFDLGFIARF